MLGLEQRRAGRRQRPVGDGMGTGPVAEAGPPTAAEDPGLALEAHAWAVPLSSDSPAPPLLTSKPLHLRALQSSTERNDRHPLLEVTRGSVRQGTVSHRTRCCFGPYATM